MGRVVDEALFKMIHDFFEVYLPIRRNCSKHTIKAYRKALEDFLDFVKAEADLNLASLTFSMLNSKALSHYLDSLEARGCSISTRNSRRNCIRAFFTYVAKLDSTKMIYKSDIEKIPLKKADKIEIIEYMSEKAVSALLSTPDRLSKKGLRDAVIMLVMYDTAARLNAIVSLKLCDLKFTSTPTVTLHEKGSKVHTLPLMKQTVKHLENYINLFHPSENMHSQVPLFYTMRKGEKSHMDGSTIRKFIKNYAKLARLKCPEVPKNVHPHMFRHSRAMHLYQHGMDLTLVSQWLDHAQLETSLIYAHADTEQKRRAMELSTPEDSPIREKLNSKRFTVTDDELLKRLYGLK